MGEAEDGRADVCCAKVGLTSSFNKDMQEGRDAEMSRDKAPEYALYMLNRQAVKNVTIPLIPGETKLSVVDSSTLQVARRGESASNLSALSIVNLRN